VQLTVRDAAKLLATTENAIYRWIDEGSIPVHVVDGQHRFNRTELLDWATGRKVPVAVEVFESYQAQGSPLPGLDVALEAGGVYDQVEGDDAAEVLRAVVRRLKLPPAMDPEFLHQVLLAREALGSTAVGDGIAIPHVRNPVVLQGCEPSVTLCYLARPIAFGALDRRPVSTLFTLISPSIRSHLHLLARLSAALHDSAFKRAVLDRRPAPAIFTEARRVEAFFPRAEHPPR
jgi:PTS system nitrogen regulatory IIA component